MKPSERIRQLAFEHAPPARTPNGGRCYGTDEIVLGLLEYLDDLHGKGIIPDVSVQGAAEPRERFALGGRDADDWEAEDRRLAEKAEPPPST